MITPLGLLILGLGLAIPSTLILIMNITLQLTSKGSYQLDFNKLAKVYIVALVGWFITLGIRI